VLVGSDSDPDSGVPGSMVVFKGSTAPRLGRELPYCCCCCKAIENRSPRNALTRATLPSVETKEEEVVMAVVGGGVEVDLLISQLISGKWDQKAPAENVEVEMEAEGGREEDRREGESVNGSGDG